MQYLKKLVGLSLLFMLLIPLVISFDFSICDTPQRAIEELGDDYYAFCENNAAPAYYSDSPQLAEKQTPVPDTFYIPKAPVSFVHESPQEYNDFSSDAYTNNLILIVGMVGIILILTLFGLLVWRKYQHKHLTLEAVNKLLPIMNQYIQAGWTLEQLSQMLLTQGYDRSFINEILKALEKKA